MLLIIQIFLWPYCSSQKNRYPNLKDAQNKGSDPQTLRLIRGEVVSECSIKYSFQPHDENDFSGGKKSPFFGDKVLFLVEKGYFFRGKPVLFWGKRSKKVPHHLSTLVETSTPIMMTTYFPEAAQSQPTTLFWVVSLCSDLMHLSK